MVQNVTNQGQNLYGSINRVGTTQDGRGVYQVNDGTGKVAGRLSVAENDCDKFEKTYQKIMEAAPKIQAFAAEATPEKLEKKKKRASWTLGISTLVGAAIPIYLTRNAKVWKQALAAIPGALVGLMGGSMIARKTLTPPGMAELNEASKTLESLDIKPMQ